MRYEFKLSAKKYGGRGFDSIFDDARRMFERKAYLDKLGYQTEVKQRQVTEWEEVRNACFDEC